jgi:hypothetical protein
MYFLRSLFEIRESPLVHEGKIKTRLIRSKTEVSDLNNYGYVAECK